MSTETAFDPTVTPPADEGAEIRPDAPYFSEGEGMEHMQDRVQQGARDADKQVRAFVAKHPLASIAGACAAGFFLGRIASRLL